MSINAPVQTFAGAAAGALGAARALLGGRIRLVERLVERGLEIATGCWRAAGLSGLGSASRRVSLDWLAEAHPKVSRALRMAVFLRARLLSILALVDCGDARKAGRALHKAGLVVGGLDDGGGKAELRAPTACRPLRPYSLDGLNPFGRDPLRRYVMSRPVAELIAEICEGLGVAPAWLAETQAAWAAAQPAGEAVGPAQPATPRLAAPAPAPPAAPSPPPRHERRRMARAARRSRGLPPRPP